MPTSEPETPKSPGLERFMPEILICGSKLHTKVKASDLKAVVSRTVVIFSLSYEVFFL